MLKSTSLLTPVVRTAGVASLPLDHENLAGLILLLDVQSVGVTPGQISAIELRAAIGAGFLPLHKFSFLGRDLSQATPKLVHVETVISGTGADKTAVLLNPVFGTAAICTSEEDYVFVGQCFPFSSINIALSTVASADTEDLVIQYWNGEEWADVEDIVDGTFDDPNTLQVNGAVSFTLPADWQKCDPVNCGTQLYFVRINVTSPPGTGPVASLFEPNSGIITPGKYAFLLHENSMPASEWTVAPKQGLLTLSFDVNVVHGNDEPITYALLAEKILK